MFVADWCGMSAADESEKIDAAIAAVEGERVMWLLGKKRRLTSDGNVFGNVLNENRYNVILNNIANEEYERSLILRVLEKGPKSVHELSSATGLPKAAVVGHIIALRKWRRIEDAGMKGQSPLYRIIKC
jgi:DNA-binding transcriptional ArsR family regulator